MPGVRNIVRGGGRDAFVSLRGRRPVAHPGCEHEAAIVVAAAVRARARVFGDRHGGLRVDHDRAPACSGVRPYAPRVSEHFAGRRRRVECVPPAQREPYLAPGLVQRRLHLLVLRDRALLVAGRVARVFFVPIGADPREELRVGRDVPFVARHFRAVLRAAIAVQAEAKIEAVDVGDGVIEAEREQLRIRLPVAGGVARRQVPRGIQIYVVEAELLERAIARACVVEALGVYVVGDFANERALVEPTEATAVLPAATVRAVIAAEAM